MRSNKTEMDALDRIKRIGRTSPGHEWQADDFRNAGNRARQLWQTIENLFNVQYGLLTDAVAVIDPQFELTDFERLAIDRLRCRLSNGNAAQRLAVSTIPLNRW
jgi:hypothetical protein